MDRYFNIFESGTLWESACAQRVERLTAELVAMESQRNLQREQIDIEKPKNPRVEDLNNLWERAKTVLEGGDLPHRKAFFQEVVQEIQVTVRGNIRPVFKLPLDPCSIRFFRPPYGSVPPVRFELTLKTF